MTASTHRRTQRLGQHRQLPLARSLVLPLRTSAGVECRIRPRQRLIGGDLDVMDQRCDVAQWRDRLPIEHDRRIRIAAESAQDPRLALAGHAVEVEVAVHPDEHAQIVGVGQTSIARRDPFGRTRIELPGQPTGEQTDQLVGTGDRHAELGSRRNVQGGRGFSQFEALAGDVEGVVARLYPPSQQRIDRRPGGLAPPRTAPWTGARSSPGRTGSCATPPRGPAPSHTPGPPAPSAAPHQGGVPVRPGGTGRAPTECPTPWW